MTGMFILNVPCVLDKIKFWYALYLFEIFYLPLSTGTVSEL
jgi:hypothetical protein